MKKFISLFLICVIIMCFSSFAYADDDVKSYTWAERSDGYHWYIEEVDADFWMPDTFLPVELTEADRAEDIIGFLSNEDGSYSVLFYSIDGDFSLYTFFGYCMDSGRDAEIVTVNSLPALVLRDPENNVASLIFQTQEKNLFQFSFSPLGNDTLMEQVFSSIRPHQEVEVEGSSKPAPVNPVSTLISK